MVLSADVASNDCSNAPSGAWDDLWAVNPGLKPMGYYPRPLPGAETEATRRPGLEAVNLGV